MTNAYFVPVLCVFRFFFYMLSIVAKNFGVFNHVECFLFVPDLLLLCCLTFARMLSESSASKVLKYTCFLFCHSAELFCLSSAFFWLVYGICSGLCNSFSILMYIYIGVISLSHLPQEMILLRVTGPQLFDKLL